MFEFHAQLYFSWNMFDAYHLAVEAMDDLDQLDVVITSVKSGLLIAGQAYSVTALSLSLELYSIATVFRGVYSALW